MYRVDNLISIIKIIVALGLLTNCITTYNSNSKKKGFNFCNDNSKYHIYLLNRYSNSKGYVSFETEPILSTKTIKNKLKEIKCIQRIEEILNIDELNHIKEESFLILEFSTTYYPPLSNASVLFLIPTRSQTIYKVYIIKQNELKRSDNIPYYQYEKRNYYWLFLLPFTPFLFDDDYEEAILKKIMGDLVG